MTVDTITTIAGAATIAVAALTVGVSALWLAARVSPAAAALQERLITSLGSQSIWLAWLVVVASAAGSLYYSEAAGFEPCTFCWYQRIALFPLLVILPVGAHRRDRLLARYVLPLTIAGAVLALYNYLIQLFPGIEVACSTEVSCSVIDIEAFGWLTLPLMSLVAFAAVTAGVLYDRAHHRLADPYQ